MPAQTLSKLPWARYRIPDGRQYFSHPSPRTRELWSHVLVIGTNRICSERNYEIPARKAGYLLHYIRSGELNHTIRGRTFNVGKGSVCFLDYSQGHRQQNSRRNCVSLWWILFDGKDLPRVFSELGADYDPVFPIANRTAFEALFRELWVLIQRQPNGYEVRAHVLLQQMLATLFLIRSPEGETFSLLADKSHLSEAISIAVNMIGIYYYQPLNLKDIAGVIKLNTRYFGRKFRQEVGVPPMRYLRLSRMEHAKSILRTTNKSIREVARLVGMPDANYFTRHFHQVTGLSPQQYRRQSSTTSAVPAKRR